MWLHVEDQKTTHLGWSHCQLFSGSAQLPLPQGGPLGADEGLSAELTCTLLPCDCGPGVLALHPVTGEPSLQRRLSPQLTGQLMAVVVVRDGGQPALSCTTALRLAPTDLAPPGGKVVLMPPPPPPKKEAEGSSWRCTVQGAGRLPGFPVVLMDVLASGCSLMLVAIATVTCSSQGEARTRRKKLCEHSPSRSHARSGQVGPSRKALGAAFVGFPLRFFPMMVPFFIYAEAHEGEAAEISLSWDSGVFLCSSLWERSGILWAQVDHPSSLS